MRDRKRWHHAPVPRPRLAGRASFRALETAFPISHAPAAAMPSALWRPSRRLASVCWLLHSTSPTTPFSPQPRGWPMSVSARVVRPAHVPAAELLANQRRCCPLPVFLSPPPRPRPCVLAPRLAKSVRGLLKVREPALPTCHALAATIASS